MANVLFWRVQFIGNHPGGTFLAGDELEFYYDNATPQPQGGFDGISVYHNDVLITSGPSPLQVSSAYNSNITSTYFTPGGICNGTTNIAFGFYFAFPYFFCVGFPDFPGCAVNPPTCDLQVIGTPTVVPASGQDQADGEIILTAASSQAIQYRIGADFVYNDGTAQATGEFTGLLPSQYRIFMRDALNCRADVLVTVPFTSEYSPVYRLEYDDYVGGETRIDISKRGYAGSVTEVIGADVPFERSLRGEGSIDKFTSLLATEAIVRLTSETDLFFSELYTNSPEDFRIYFYKNLVLKGVYKVIPQQYGEDHKAPPYYVNVKATDGLPSLKDFPFLQDDGQRFNGSMKAIKLIAFILSKIRLDINIRVAINLYAVGMNQTDSDDPLDQAYLDTDTYYMHEDNPRLDNVLKQILEPFGARIIQENAVWNIVRIEELRGEYDYREFDSNGDYVSNSSYNPIVDIVNPSTTTGVYLSDNDHYMMLCPGYGKIRIFYRLGLRENILENGDFRLKSVFQFGNSYALDLDTLGWQLVNSDYPLSSSYEFIDGNNNVAWKIQGDSNVTLNTGNAYFQSDTYNVKMGTANTLKIKIRYKLPIPVAYGLTPIPISIPYQKVRIRVKYGSYYLLSNGTWTTSENFITVYATEFNKFLEEEFIAVQPDTGASSGYNFDIRVYHSYIYHAEYSSFTDLKARVTYTSPDPVLPDGTKTEVSTAALLQDVHYYELEENTDAENQPLIVRPNDYHVTNNPRQWVRKQRLVKTIFTSFTSPFWLDKVAIEFLTNGEQSVDTIIREIAAEPRNTTILDKVVTHGSYQSLITTIPSLGLSLSTGSFSFSLTTVNILSADILFAGYFRDSTGAGFVNWTRDGMSEESSLHLILLQQLAAQYKRSWRKLTGTLYSDTQYFSFLDVFRMTSDSNRLYFPIGGTIQDLVNKFTGELMELMDVTAVGSGTSGFTRGFKQSGFR